MAGNGQMIIDLDRKRMTAMAEKDIRTLNDIISDELVYTHSSARLDTKQSLIGNMESGSTVYTSVVPSNVKAQDLGDTVVLTGECKISVNAGGRPNSFASMAPATLNRSVIVDPIAASSCIARRTTSSSLRLRRMPEFAAESGSTRPSARPTRSAPSCLPAPATTTAVGQCTS